ncbi:MAG: TraM recognition domain-containing protein [Acidobacteria bacterium]|nr:TraM recognition domain-containing protein [Acidobacteriota bacterium]
MIRTLVEHRITLSFAGSACCGLLLLQRIPFPEDNALLTLVGAHQPALVTAIRWGYVAMLFSSPFLCCSAVFSLLYIFVVQQRERRALRSLPTYPNPAQRDRLFLVIGEVHHAKRPVPSEQPFWLTIPDRGLFTGIVVLGAIGSGKTSCCMYPFAEQILAYRCTDAARRIGGMVLEVKGDFCGKVQKLLARHGRTDDYVEVAIDGEYRYNPLHNDLEAYTLAYGIASLLNNLFGKGKEPFWQQAYTNLVKFIILLHKVTYDYVTLFDVYECAINPERLESRIREAEKRFHTAEYLLVSDADYLANRELAGYAFERDSPTGEMKAPIAADLLRYLDANRIPYSTVVETGGQAATAEDKATDRKRQQLEAVKRWFYHDWRRIEPKLRTSIVEGVSVFLSLFDDNPSVKKTFCPPKECYDPELNSDGRYGKPLPGFGDMIESGKVVALNFPVSANPGLARAIGTLMKQDFQRAVLNRIPAMEREPDRHWREVLFLCDEYQSFATVGESDPTGDEKFFALSRQAKCIPIVATQSLSSLRSTLPGESWRTLLQTFRTKIILAVSDDFSMRTASELCGKEEQFKLSYSLSENDQDARVSVLTGRATAHRATVSTSKSYNLQRDWVFEAKVFGELKNAQSIVLAYDGVNPHAPTYCYLKPYYLDPNHTYFQQLQAGEI